MGELKDLAPLAIFTMLGCPEAPEAGASKPRVEAAYTYEDGVRDGRGLMTGWLADGAEYRLKRKTPLMPEVDPVDVFVAIEGMQSLEAGVKFKVHAIRMKGRIPWYRVVTEDWRSGWINSQALLGQNIVAEIASAKD